MISIICCYTKKEVLESMLMESLKKQKTKFETIFIDNTDNTFSSAAKALNFGLNRSNGEYILFVHQDILFEDENFLEKIKLSIKEIGSDIIVGSAGITEKDKVYSNMKHGPNMLPAGQFTIVNPVRVQTLDEVMLAAKKSIFEKINFDEVTCDNWHLYGADLCLSAACKGIDSYAIPLNIYHKSMGNVDNDYMKSLHKLVEKHKKNYPMIYTTNTVINTAKYNKCIFSLIYFTKRYIRRKLKIMGISKQMFSLNNSYFHNK